MGTGGPVHATLKVLAHALLEHDPRKCFPGIAAVPDCRIPVYFLKCFHRSVFLLFIFHVPLPDIRPSAGIH